MKSDVIYPDTKKSILIIAVLAFAEVVFQILMQISESFAAYFLYAISPQIIIMNFLPVFLIMLALYFLTNRISVSYIAFTLLFDLMLIINHYKIYFRDEPLKPADLVLFNEATNIMGNYRIMPSLKIIVLNLLLVFLGYLVLKYVKKSATKLYVRLIGLVVTIGIAVLSYNYIYKNSELYDKISWVPNEYHETSVVNCKGFLYSFINNIARLNYEKPDNYSKEYAKEILAEYKGEEVEEQLPNVIAIMSEAFFDPYEAKNLKYNMGRNPLLNYYKIKKESYYGDITVPGFAGATALTEFEFLTGINISLIDKGMPSPYNRFINKKMNALPWYFKDKGFETVAIHPGNRWFYNRLSVYKYLGFDRSIFIEDLDFKPEKTNYYTNDSETAKLIINDYKKHLEENPDKGYFNFTVTIQNHGPYINTETDRPRRIMKLPDISDELFYTINNYMDGLSDADNFLEEIKDFTETLDKPTVIVFFGDHLPYFDSELEGYEAIGYDISTENLESLNRKYSTPYIICSNKAFKNMQAEQNKKVLRGKAGNISSSFLITNFFDYLGVEAPEYVKYLDTVKDKVNIISPYYYMQNGKLTEEIDEEAMAELEKLKILQYYNIKDYNNE